MFDISERSERGRGGRAGVGWIGGVSHPPLEAALPPLCPPPLPLLLEMRFHANLSLRKLSRVFTLPSRWSRASLHVNHAQPPDIFPPPSPRVATRATPILHSTNEDEIGNLKIASFFFSLRVFFLFGRDFIFDFSRFLGLG